MGTRGRSGQGSLPPWGRMSEPSSCAGSQKVERGMKTEVSEGTDEKSEGFYPTSQPSSLSLVFLEHDLRARRSCSHHLFYRRLCKFRDWVIFTKSGSFEL